MTDLTQDSVAQPNLPSMISAYPPCSLKHVNIRVGVRNSIRHIYPCLRNPDISPPLLLARLLRMAGVSRPPLQAFLCKPRSMMQSLHSRYVYTNDISMETSARTVSWSSMVPQPSLNRDGFVGRPTSTKTKTKMTPTATQDIFNRTQGFGYKATCARASPQSDFYHCCN